jgi:hypothetical protein
MTRQGDEAARWRDYSSVEGIYIPGVDLWYGVLKGCVYKIFMWKLSTSCYCQICHVVYIQSVTCNVRYKDLPPCLKFPVRNPKADEGKIVPCALNGDTMETGLTL